LEEITEDLGLDPGGTSRVTEVAGINVEIEGQNYVADCLFGSNKTPILGRETILSAMDIGFDVYGWLLKLSTSQVSSLQTSGVNSEIKRRFVSRDEYEELQREGPDIRIEE